MNGTRAVRVLLFGAAADQAGARELELQVRDGATLGDLWNELTGRYPGLTPMGDTLAFAVNQEYAGMERRVSPGDEVAILPPVSGG
ncbi:molybdopterin converting factor subunit 1 [Rubrobacter taiwanensis]|nr:molybdopterin converting factor subunit 1 [Rubrobacter taiwanensis]